MGMRNVKGVIRDARNVSIALLLTGTVALGGSLISAASDCVKEIKADITDYNMQNITVNKKDYFDFWKYEEEKLIDDYYAGKISEEDFRSKLDRFANHDVAYDFRNELLTPEQAEEWESAKEVLGEEDDFTKIGVGAAVGAATLIPGGFLYAKYLKEKEKYMQEAYFDDFEM